MLLASVLKKSEWPSSFCCVWINFNNSNSNAVSQTTRQSTRIQGNIKITEIITEKVDANGNKSVQKQIIQQQI